MTGQDMLRLVEEGRTVSEVARAAGVGYLVAWKAIARARDLATGGVPTFVCAACGGVFIVDEDNSRYRHSLRCRVGGRVLCEGCAARRFRRMTRSPLRAGSPCFIVEHGLPPRWARSILAPLLLAAALALPRPSPAALAGGALRALAVLSAAQWAGVVPASDAAAARAWLTRPGFLPDEAAVQAYLDPSLPMPEGDALPPRLRLLGDDARLTAFVRSLPGVVADVTVRTAPRGPSRFDQSSRVIFLAEDADLPALLHEAGHAAVGTDEEAVYQRTFRDFPGAARPEDTALYRCEREADAAYSADLLSVARATRSYWRGIKAHLGGD